MATCDPTTLAAQAQCFTCIPVNELAPLILQMICDKAIIKGCNPDSLATEASCFACLTPGEWPILENILWCKIAQAIAGSSCDPNTVMANAACFECLPAELWPYLEAQMLCNSL